MQLSSKLKALPHTVVQLLQEMLQRLETDHGHVLVSHALSLLVCTRHGLLHDELQQLLSYAHLLNGTKMTSYIWTALIIRCFETFVCSDEFVDSLCVATSKSYLQTATL